MWSSIADKLSDEQLRMGCQRCKQSESYLPTPARFIFLCHGLIDTDQAYGYALRHKYPHPAIWWAANDAGMFNTRYRGSVDEQERSFRRMYGIRCDEVISGKELIMPEQDQTKLLTSDDKIRYNDWASAIQKKYGVSPQAVSWDDAKSKVMEKMA